MELFIAKSSQLPLTANRMHNLQILGLEEHIAGLKIIHVAGTKGKVHFFHYSIFLKSDIKLKKLVTFSLYDYASKINCLEKEYLIFVHISLSN